MKTRTPGFLADDKIDHDSEIFDYIRELHEYLWRFVKVVRPYASGYINDYIDATLTELESKYYKG